MERTKYASYKKVRFLPDLFLYPIFKYYNTFEHLVF